MKRTILTLAVLGGFAALAAPAIASAYCTGYQDGYRAGFCANKLNCYSVIAPGCPSGNWDRNTYQDGYNRGYAAGVAAARRS